VDALPTFWDKVTFVFGNNGWEYGGPHFPIAATDYVVPLENSIKLCNLNILGRGLHTLQDYYGHWSGPGPWAPFIHHITGSAMDYGAMLNDDWRAGPALDETEDWLRDFKGRCLKCCD
jgi:hypothetical protein